VSPPAGESVLVVPGAQAGAAPSPLALRSLQPLPTAAAPLLYDVGRIFARIGTTLLFDLKVFGVHNVPRRGGVLLLANHQSYLDPVLIGVRLQRPLSFLAKSELFEHGTFAWLIRNFNAFPVRQGAGDVGAMRETIRRLQEGHALVVFPEGSRTPDGQIHPLQSGFALIARKVNVPIVPVTIDGSFETWGKGRRLRPHRIRVSYGPPVDVKQLRPAEIVRRVEQTLRAQFEDLQSKPTITSR
jgi:1-acyl-sn-glycerol-3-phosphate acyltransferase